MTKIFQLTAVSQNDPGCESGTKFTGKVTHYKGGTLRSGSFPVNTPVPLPIPPSPSEQPPASPTWFLELDNGIDAGFFEIHIQGPGNFQDLPIKIEGSDVAQWTRDNKNGDTNQIYFDGNCGVFGYATPLAPDGWIYTITVAVTDPKVHPGN